jgi:hypothetical protein
MAEAAAEGRHIDDVAVPQGEHIVPYFFAHQKVP